MQNKVINQNLLHSDYSRVLGILFKVNLHRDLVRSLNLRS